jgi:cell division protein FtsN
MDQGFDSNGKRQTARLPFASGDSSSGGQSLGGQRYNQSDVYATRIGDDFDDVLDVPIQPQSGYQMVDETQPGAVFEDVYTAGQSQDQPSPYDFTAYDKPAATPIDTFRPGASRQREADGYVEPAEQDFVGWPVLPEGAEEEEESSGNGRGGLFLRIGLAVGLVGVVCFWAYYFLGDFISKRMGRQDQTSVQTADPSATAGASDSATSQTPEPQVASDTQVARSLPGGDPGASDSASPQIGRSKDEQQAKVEELFKAPPQSPPKDNVVTFKPPPKSERLNRSPGVSDPVKPLPPPTGASNRSRLTIQVGSFKDQGEADARASGLNAATDGAFHVVRADIPGRGVWYRVQQVSGFASREAASSYGNQLRARNLISEFIVTLR